MGNRSPKVFLRAVGSLTRKQLLTLQMISYFFSFIIFVVILVQVARSIIVLHFRSRNSLVRAARVWCWFIVCCIVACVVIWRGFFLLFLVSIRSLIFLVIVWRIFFLFILRSLFFLFIRRGFFLVFLILLRCFYIYIVCIIIRFTLALITFIDDIGGHSLSKLRNLKLLLLCDHVFWPLSRVFPLIS